MAGILIDSVLLAAFQSSNRKRSSKNEKADVVEHPQVLDHVGLLSNEPLGRAGMLSI
jgi:hypothetical protein